MGARGSVSASVPYASGVARVVTRRGDPAQGLALAERGLSLLDPGVALVRATAGFTDLIRTEGKDVAHLMTGIERLAAIFGSIYAAAIVASLLLVMSLALLVVFA